MDADERHGLVFTLCRFKRLNEGGQALAWWLESLGLCMVIMDKTTAEAMVAASDAPDMTVSTHTPYAGRTRRREVVRRQVLRLVYSFPGQRAA